MLGQINVHWNVKRAHALVDDGVVWLSQRHSVREIDGSTIDVMDGNAKDEGYVERHKVLLVRGQVRPWLSSGETPLL